MSRNLRLVGFHAPESKNVGVSEQSKTGPIADIRKRRTADVIAYWLYSKDKEILIAASIELRRRLSTMYPRPDWFGE